MVDHSCPGQIPDPGPLLVAAVRELLGQARNLLGAQMEPRLGRLAASLTEPLTVAVAGRTNAGKSTLVNALIGARIAPTRATESTKVVTWFRYGPHQPQVVCRDGDIVPLGFTRTGQLPDELGVAIEKVDRVEVCVSFEPLKQLTVIDTPGLSGDEGLADQTEKLLSGGDADVLLFVFNPAVLADEQRVVSDFWARSRAVYDFPATVLGVLSRADQLSDQARPDTWANAQAQATAHARTLAAQVAGVCPVMGKIAETTETGGFDEAQAGWLRTVAALEPAQREEALFDADEFRNVDCLADHQRAVLLDRLDMHGIRVLANSIRQDTSAVEMREQLREISGIAALRERIAAMFVRRAAVHKSVRVLAELEAMINHSTMTRAQREQLEDGIDTIRDSPPMAHTLAELRALAALYSGRCALIDGEQHEAALRLFGRADACSRLGVWPASAAELAEHARKAHDWWRTIARMAPDSQTTLVADTAARSAYLIYDALRRAT